MNPTKARIIINGNHHARLEELLNEAQRRCTARTLTVAEIEAILHDAEQELGIPKKHLCGTTIHYSGARHFANAYSRRAYRAPDSTHFRAVHNGRHWVVTDVSRSWCPNRNDNVAFDLSPSAKVALLRRFNTCRI